MKSAVLWIAFQSSGFHDGTCEPKFASLKSIASRKNRMQTRNNQSICFDSNFYCHSFFFQPIATYTFNNNF